MPDSSGLDEEDAVMETGGAKAKRERRRCRRGELRKAIEEHCRLFDLDEEAQRRLGKAAALLKRTARRRAEDGFRDLFSKMGES